MARSTTVALASARSIAAQQATNLCKTTIKCCPRRLAQSNAVHPQDVTSVARHYHIMQAFRTPKLLSIGAAPQKITPCVSSSSPIQSARPLPQPLGSAPDDKRASTSPSSEALRQGLRSFWDEIMRPVLWSMFLKLLALVPLGELQSQHGCAGCAVEVRCRVHGAMILQLSRPARIPAQHGQGMRLMQGLHAACKSAFRDCEATAREQKASTPLNQLEATPVPPLCRSLVPLETTRTSPCRSRAIQPLTLPRPPLPSSHIPEEYSCRACSLARCGPPPRFLHERVAFLAPRPLPSFPLSHLLRAVPQPDARPPLRPTRVCGSPVAGAYRSA